MGIAWRTYFTRISLLGKLRALKVQRLSFLWIFSTSSFQEICLIVEFAIGAPRYLEGRLPSENSKILRIFILVILGVLKKQVWDFSLLISRPLASRKVFKHSLIPLASCTGGGGASTYYRPKTVDGSGGPSHLLVIIPGFCSLLSYSWASFQALPPQLWRGKEIGGPLV